MEIYQTIFVEPKDFDEAIENIKLMERMEAKIREQEINKAAKKAMADFNKKWMNYSYDEKAKFLGRDVIFPEWSDNDRPKD